MRNQLSPTQVKGLVEFIAATVDTPSQVGISSSFSNLDGHWAAAFVQVLVNRGFISGFPDGTFQPSTTITSAQSAALITNTFQLPDSNYLNKFKDVRTDFWAAGAIVNAANGGFLGGFPDGTFPPGRNLTKVQAIVYIVNGLKCSGSNPNGLRVY